MILVMEIVGEHAGVFGRGSRHLFKGVGGTIGRSSDSTWVLDEQAVSARHAIVHCSRGEFSLTDISSNGVRVNKYDNLLTQLEPYLIQNHDLILVGNLMIKATLLDEHGLPK
jgi:predicted component of type VI protein secretion system